MKKYQITVMVTFELEAESMSEAEDDVIIMLSNEAERNEMGIEINFPSKETK